MAQSKVEDNALDGDLVDDDRPGLWKFLKRNFFNEGVTQAAHQVAQRVVQSYQLLGTHGWRSSLKSLFDAATAEFHAASDAAYEDTYGQIGWTALVGMPFLSSVVLKDKKTVTINSWDKIKENFAGWKEEHGLGFNVLKALIMIPLNIALIPVRMAINIIRLGTGLIPAFFKHLFNAWAVEFWDWGRQESKLSWSSLFYFSIATLAFVFFLPFKLFQVIERAILAPQDSVRAAWEAGKDLAGDGGVGKVVSFLFTLISATITGLAYAILFPLLVKFILTSAPTVVAEAIQTATTTLEPLSNAGDALNVIVTPIVELLGLEAAASSWVALSAIVGVGIGHTIVAAELAGKEAQDGCSCCSPENAEDIEAQLSRYEIQPSKAKLAEDAKDDTGCCVGASLFWLMLTSWWEDDIRPNTTQEQAQPNSSSSNQLT